ncbi:tetratricopeptide repeat-containing sensor histidine kinase [Mangrovibacterium diazotrophicum]|uniref:histidine kinase n=1 Tax=Mangrovibacterium diazotrophicum TaxID=1261403 RepID=A0A419VWX7_9BACT|nr:tetratricopeptide repeat protein [Mangrovibacterium diazotrophicum]RKD87689.1 signal transduction histidine kinase [Mangrovibacterium diazotrophicum]
MGRTIVCALTCLLFSVFFSPLYGQQSDSEESTPSDQLSRLQLVQKLSDQCWQNRESQTEKAIEYGLQAIGIAKAEGFQKELGTLYNYLGVIYQHYKYDVRTAMSYYDLGLPICLAEKDSVEIAYVYNNLGDAFYTIGNVPLAFEYAEKSMSIFERLGNARGIAYSYINLGALNRIDGKYNAALDYFRKAISLRETFDDSVGIASANLEVARTLYLMGKTDEAMQYFQQSLQKHTQIDNKNYMAYSMQGIGDVYLQKNELDSAMVYFEEAMKLTRDRRNFSGEIDSQLGLAKVMAAKGKLEEGEHLLDDAFINAQRSNIAPDILKVYKARGEYYHQSEDYKKAAENYQSYIQAYDSLFLALQFQTLSEMKDRFHIKEELNTVTQDLKSKRKVQIYAVLIIILLIIFSFILMLRNRIIARLSTELAHSNQAKDKIFSIVSHDLVSPFNVLIGTSELLMEDLDEGDLENAKNNGRLIHSTSEEAYRLISNLLTWARSQRRTINLVKEKFDMTNLALDVVSMFENHSELKEIEIQLSAPGGVLVTADKNLVQIVLVNLVNNALKFTHRGGKINLSVAEEKGKVKVSVRDNGTGMPPDRLAHLFDHRSVESTPGTGNEQGTGLGLLLCKEFVEMHGGEIYADSMEGEGSTFIFTVPAV